MGVPARHAAQVLLASVQPRSGFPKVPPERSARSCRMTSIPESVNAELQTEPLPNSCAPSANSLFAIGCLRFPQEVLDGTAQSGRHRSAGFDVVNLVGRSA